MNLREAVAALENISSILEQWDRAGQIDLIDKELAEEKLRTVYETVRFYRQGSGPGDGDNNRIPASDELPETKPADFVPRDVAPPADTCFVATAGVDMQTVQVDESPESLQGGASATFSVEVENDPENSPVSCEADFIEDSVQNEDDTADRIQDNPFENKSKIDRSVLMSLYSDDCPTEVIKPFAPETTVNVVDTSQNNDLMRPRPENPPTMDIHTPGPDIEEAHSPAFQAVQPTTVLGETLNNGEQTVSDAYAMINNQPDVASQIASAASVTLRSSIGLNDKFMLIRDLFGGDTGLYEKTITAMDNLADLDDVLIYIHDNFSWDPESQAVRMLMELLMRKFS